MEQNFGELLRMLRRRRGMTQGDLARALGITVQTVVRYESLPSSAGLRPARLKEIADVLGVSVPQLSGAAPEEEEEIAVLARGLRRMDPARRESLISLMMPFILQYQKEGDDDDSVS